MRAIAGFEASVTGASAAFGLTVGEVALAPGDLVAAVVRHSGPKPVADVGRLGSGDRVLVVTGPGGEQRSTADHETTGA
jgi:hypothetical protein